MMRVLKNAAEFLGLWLTSPVLPFREKVGYPLRVAQSLLTRRGKLVYLGREFQYDNIRTPFLIMRYPTDIGECLLKHTGTSITSVLDIGGNLGQFSVVLDHFLPNLETLDIFEVNPRILDMLRHNAPPQSRIFAYGVGQPGKRTFYSPAKASVGGSLLKERATCRRYEPLQMEIELVNEIAPITGHSHYDLVKIDVEGAELEVLKTLEVSMTYLWLEVTGCEKPGSNYRSSELLHTIYQRFGEFDILYSSEWDAQSVGDLLIAFR